MSGVIGVALTLVIWRFAIVFGATVFESAGLSTSAAGFEARSALVGAGYTTSQSELVVRYPAARRVASSLVVFGYFGPAAVLALLGLAFIPDGADRVERGVILLLLLFGLVLLDRLGALRSAARRPASALARRITKEVDVERWLVVGDHAVTAVVVPLDPDRAEPVVAALTTADVTILGIEPQDADPSVFPHGGDVVPAPGDRVVAFGPQVAFDSIRAG